VEDCSLYYSQSRHEWSKRVNSPNRLNFEAKGDTVRGKGVEGQGKGYCILDYSVSSLA